MLALEEKTMTSPMLTSSSVAIRSERSGHTFFERLNAIGGRSLKLVDQLFEMAAALFIVLILIKGGAGRRQEHGLARPGDLGRPVDSLCQIADFFEWHQFPELLLDAPRIFPDQQKMPYM